jgi:hypothetical protein
MPGRARYPPNWRRARAAGMAVRAARERAFCRTREPAGVLEMLAWSPAVQKAAGLVSRSCRNRREQEGPPPAGTGPACITGPGRGRELRPALLESYTIFSRNILLVSDC